MSSPLARAEFTSQGTQIEQARATADVIAAMEAAKRWPRDEDGAHAKMLRSCRRERVASSAFWAFRRGRENLTGPTVQLMRTIAAIWGNCSFGARELSRDPRRELSEMHAWAWDLESNLRIEETFIVPWVIDTKDGPKRLTSNRDIRDLLSNVAQRKVRTQIANMLPDWYVADAEDTARAVIEQADRPIDQVRAEVGKMLAGLGVALPRVLARVGRNAWDETTRGDLANLRIAAQTVNREEATVDEIFPAPVALTPAVVLAPEQGARPVAEHAAPAAPAPAQPAAEAAAPAPAAEAPETAPTSTETPDEAAPDDEHPAPARTALSVAQVTGARLAAREDAPAEDAAMQPRTMRALMALFAEGGVDPKTGRAARLHVCSLLIGRLVGTANELTEREGLMIEQALRETKRVHGDDGMRDAVAVLAEMPAGGES